MKLQVHPEQLQALAAHLAKAGDREIGGVLVGEHVSENVFRLVDLSFQESPGTKTCFVRRPEEHERFFADFFERTGRDFERFNYIGEWHSHPSFPAWPSRVDHTQMQDIVGDDVSAPIFQCLLLLASRAEPKLNSAQPRIARVLGRSPSKWNYSPVRWRIRREAGCRGGAVFLRLLQETFGLYASAAVTLARGPHENQIRG